MKPAEDPEEAAPAQPSEALEAEIAALETMWPVKRIATEEPEETAPAETTERPAEN